jgi:site-specific recombinase XerD
MKDFSPQMTPTFGILFYVKKTKVLANGLYPVYLRITVNGERTEIATKRSIPPSKWIAGQQKYKGTTEDARHFNAYLESIRNQVYSVYRELSTSDSAVTANAIKHAMMGTKANAITLKGLFAYHLGNKRKLQDIQFSKSTITRYETVENHVFEFMKNHLQIDDIPLNSINFQFVTELDYYLRVTRCNNPNTACKYIKIFKSVILVAIKNEWMTKDPFLNYKFRLQEVERHALSMEEVDRLYKHDFTIERIANVRDIFVFCCYTGLAYVDVFELSRNNIITGIDGESWIETHRKKTDSRTRLPILPRAMEIINNYKHHPKCIADDKLLPVLSNQKMNAYLKEIATVCNIRQNLTTHLARHTFATTTTLGNGVPMETVSKMLGHSSISTTQIYSKVLDNKISDDMGALRTRFESKPTRQKDGTFD